MKIYEGIICNRLVAFLDKKCFFSPLQTAYRKRRSTADHIFVIHELFLEYRYNRVGPRGGKVRIPLYFCFLDLRKAFDTVPRHLLFSKLYNAGIRGKMLRVIQDLFSSNLANVLIDEFLSPDFIINRGVLQGSKLGPILFNIFINDLLDELEGTGLGACIGPINIPALGFADDIVLITDDPKKLQTLIGVCQTWANGNGMSFNTSKCKVMIFNGPMNDPTFTLNREVLKIAWTYKYLGILLSSKYVTNLFRQHYADIVERANIKASIIRRHGFHEDGFSLYTAIRLYKIVIRPVLEYCAQTLTYSRYCKQSSLAEAGFVRKLEHLQTQILKKLINCPRAVSPATVRLFCGVEPLACRFELLKVRYFWRILRGTPGTLPHRLLEHRRANLLNFNRGFAHEVFGICNKYHVLHIWNGDAGNVKNPLHAIKRIIISQNLTRDLGIARTKGCAFAALFLSAPTRYTRNYHLPYVF